MEVDVVRKAVFKESKKELFHYFGDIFMVEGSATMLIQHDYGKISLIDLSDGNRFDIPVPVDIDEMICPSRIVEFLRGVVDLEDCSVEYLNNCKLTIEEQ